MWRAQTAVQDAVSSLWSLRSTSARWRAGDECCRPKPPTPAVPCLEPPCPGRPSSDWPAGRRRSRHRCRSRSREPPRDACGSGWRFCLCVSFHPTGFARHGLRPGSLAGPGGSHRAICTAQPCKRPRSPLHAPWQERSRRHAGHTARRRNDRRARDLCPEIEVSKPGPAVRQFPQFAAHGQHAEARDQRNGRRLTIVVLDLPQLH